MIFFSIIIPCYNQAEYLEEAVLSVIAQTYTNWECFIVNDGSTDNTEEVAIDLKKKDVRIKYLKKENGGLASARNFGINKALGKWILPLDADDKIGDLYLELAYQEIRKNNDIAIIYCKANYFGSVNEEWILPDANFRKLLITNLIFCSAIYKKSDWSKVGGYDIYMKYGVEDWEFWINILKTDKYRIIKKIDYLGFYYRIKDKSMSTDFRSDKNKKLAMHTYIYEKHKQLYIDNFGSFQDILLDRELLEEKKNNIRVYVRNIKYNILTKSLYRIILFLNKM